MIYFRKTCCLIFLLTLIIGNLRAEDLFFDSFDNELADEGPPDNFVCFGTAYTSSVVNSRNPYSGINSSIFTLHFTPGTWGGGMITKDFEPTNFRGATLSVNVCASQDLTGISPILSFRLADADGTIMRSDLQDMFVPTNMYQTFTLPVSKIGQLDYKGTDGILDITNIVSVGICIYNYGEVEGVVHFYIDDFRAYNDALSNELSSTNTNSNPKASQPPIDNTTDTDALSRW